MSGTANLPFFQLDRVEPAIFAKPTNYGFIPQTIRRRRWQTDALIITNEPLPAGIFLEARVIGVMKFEDDGEIDDKVIVVPADGEIQATRSHHSNNYRNSLLRRS